MACERTTEDDQVHVELRADPIDDLADIPGILAAQINSLRLAGTHATLVLAPDFYKLSLLERPMVDETELNEALRWQLQENVDFDVTDAAIDSFALPNSASRGKPMQFVAAAANEQLRCLVGYVCTAGLKVKAIEISELALRNLVYKLFDSPDQAVGVLRITASGGLINVSRGDELFLARRLSGVPAEFSPGDWAEFKERLLLQVQRSIDYYESALSQPPCNVLLVASTQGWQDHVVEYLDETLPLLVKPLGPELATHFDVKLFNPEPTVLDWASATKAEINALAAAIPALGGALPILEQSA